MKLTAFTICHHPSLHWFMDNYFRNHEKFDKWILVLGWTDIQYKGIERFLNITPETMKRQIAAIHQEQVQYLKDITIPA